MKLTTDIVIVGCGPAGSSTAITAAKKGAKVLLVDRKTNVGIPVQCGEAIGKSGATIAELEIPKESIRAEVRGFRVFSPIGDFIDYAKKEPDGYIVDRRVFDKELFAKAIEMGADSLLGLNVLDILWSDKKVAGIIGRAHGESVEIDAKIVVGADGVNSTIARKARLRRFIKPEDLDVSAGFEMVNVKYDDEQLLEFYFGREIAPRGYVWIFPKGNNRANVGIGVGGGTFKETAKLYLEKFVKKNPLGNKKCGDARVIEFRIGAIPVGGVNKKNTLDNLMLVGDAAGHVHPVTGGGIGYAMVGGSYCGKVAVDALEAGDTSDQMLQRYDRMWRDRYQHEFVQGLKLRDAIVDTDDDTLNKLATILQGEEIVSLTAGKKLQIVGKLLATRDPKLIKLVSRLKELKMA
ncbi:MAG: geranylgeranyl reductase family protein [Candidatus Ranarchaeia archaeon]